MEKFDSVIVDAPCSNIGIIRRKPELKLYYNDFILKNNIYL